MGTTAPVLAEVVDPMVDAPETQDKSWTFDYDAYHCRYDPADLLAGVEEHITTQIAALADRPLAELNTQDWKLLADRVERAADTEPDPNRREALAEAAAQIGAGMHQGCDCATLEADWVRECIEEYFATYTQAHRLVFFAYYDFEEDARQRTFTGHHPDPDPGDNVAVLARESFEFEHLADQFAGRGYDAFRLTFEPDTGYGTISFSDRGWGPRHPFYVITDPARVEFLDIFYEFGGPESLLARQAANVPMHPTLTRTVRLLCDLGFGAITAGAACGTGPYADPHAELARMGAADVFATLQRAGFFTAGERVWNMTASLAASWDGSISELVEVGLAATA